jgi:ATP-binding cassette subfamily B protein
MLRLAWRYKADAIKIVVLQFFLLAMALSGLGLSGVGIDVIKEQVVADSLPPQWPLGIAPPADWSAMAKVLTLGIAIFVIALLRFGLDRWSTVRQAYLVHYIVADLRTMVYDKLQRLSFRFFDANESGSIINRVTGDVQAMRAFMEMALIKVVMLLISLTFFLIYMLSIHVTLTLVCLMTTPLMIVLTTWFGKTVKPAYRRNRELFDNTVRVLSENVRGHHVVKGFSLEEPEIRKFRQSNLEFKDQQRWIFWRVSIFVPIIQLLPMINLIILLMFGGYLHIQGQIAFGSGLIVFGWLLQQFSNQISEIAQITNIVQRSLTGSARVFEVLDAPVEIQSPANALPMQGARGEVRFEHVTFRYKADADPVLEDINFLADPGQTVAVLGATGSGKTTLLSLIPRFYDPEQGSIQIDGRDVRHYDLDDLRRSVGVVFQESFLFSQSVAENIAFGHPDATREQIEKAAKIAQAHDFIMEELDDGYDTVLSESGNNLSGGQRQRLAIARAILLEPPILLLDDPTAAIDPETEHEILEAMNRAMKGRTTFVVAHRLSTLRRADKVLVLDKGRIVQHGTHAKLISEEGHYSHAANLQIADDESKRLLGMTAEDGQEAGL